MKKLLFNLAILSGGVLSAAFAQTTSRTLPDEARNVKNDPVLVRQFLEKSRNFQKRQMSSESAFQQVRPLKIRCNYRCGSFSFESEIERSCRL